MNIKALQVGPIGTNCYILCDEVEKLCAVIDPGGDADRVAVAVEWSGCTPCAILLTHGHYDHTGAVAELQAKWPEVPTYLSRRDQGAGDSYIAAFLYGIVEGLTIDEAMEKGAANATETLKYFGAW